MLSNNFRITASPGFAEWLTQIRASLAFTTYQAGKLFLLGVKPTGQMGVFVRTFERCLGLWSDGQSLWMSSKFQIWRFENQLAEGQIEDGFDRIYVPLVGHITGALDAHDIAMARDGRIIFVNTLFSCLATLSAQHSFTPLWRPSFISKLAAEDRCHLNGVAVEDGNVRYVTLFSQSDTAEAWRAFRETGGCVWDVNKDVAVCEALSMPHSPRVYRGKLWVLNSGTGQFGYVDLVKGTFEAISFCPGYARGLSFFGQYAVVGLSEPRERAFHGLPLDRSLERYGSGAICGLIVIDLESGNVVETLRIEGVVNELYDVVLLPGVMRPKALGMQTGEIEQKVWFVDQGRIVNWSASARQ